VSRKRDLVPAKKKPKPIKIGKPKPVSKEERKEPGADI